MKDQTPSVPQTTVKYDNDAKANEFSASLKALQKAYAHLKECQQAVDGFLSDEQKRIVQEPDKYIYALDEEANRAAEARKETHSFRYGLFRVGGQYRVEYGSGQNSLNATVQLAKAGIPTH